MSVYGMDLRRKIVAALGRGETVASVARRFEVDQKTVRSYRRRAAQGRLEPERGGHRGPTKLTEADLVTLGEALAGEPGLTLRELREKLSVPVALSTVSRTLQRLELTLKKSR
ncbi:MAG: helix-turn-helix domain-containing protein [Planctomycetota bacterium]